MYIVLVELDAIESVIDLHRLINEIYELARFDLAIDYSQVIKPALSYEYETWVRGILESI